MINKEKTAMSSAIVSFLHVSSLHLLSCLLWHIRASQGISRWLILLMYCWWAFCF